MSWKRWRRPSTAARAWSGAAASADSQRSRITAFYVGGADPRELKKGLYEVLPAYMIPGAFRRLEALPMTANGKLATSRQLLEQAGRKV